MLSSITARPDSPGRPGGPWITQIFIMNNYIASRLAMEKCSYKASELITC